MNNDPDALFNHAFSLHQAGNINEAVPLYQQLHAQFPNNTEILSLLGTAWLQLDNLPEGIRFLEHSLKISPDQPIALANIANALHKLKRFDESLLCYERAIDLQPDLADAYCSRGIVLTELNRFEEALMSYNRAVALKPDFAIAYSNRGNILSNLKRFEEALENYNCAISLAPDFVNAYCNRGAALKEIKRFDEALADCDHAISIEPNCHTVYWNKAFIKLMLGDYEEGWKLYEWRWKTFLKHCVRTFNQPLWHGDGPISGKTILIYSEQGLGDVIQASRYVLMLNALAAKVILEVPASLTSIMRTLKGNVEVVESGSHLPNFDFQCPIMSLPLAFKTTVESIPADVPYLFSDITKQKEWQDRLGQKTKKRIGIVCSGSTTHDDDSKRSIPLKFMKQLLNLPFEFHILQKEIRPDDAEVLVEFPDVKIHHENLVDFSDTAALVNEMDLVISVDTSVAHLAGALGKTLWVLIPWVPDFRWLLDRTDSPWYPTATLFRQPDLGNWFGVIERICQELGGTTEVCFDKSWLFDNALSLHQSGRVTESVLLYKQLLNQFPNETQILNLLGAASLQLNNYEEGVSILERSLQINQDQVMALSNMGFGLHKLQRFEEAVAYCDHAITLNPNLAAAHNNRANSLKQLKRFEEAIISSDRAISLQPDLADAHNTRGTLYRELKQYDKALESFDRAISLQPNFADALNNKGTALYELQCFDEALISYNAAIALRPDFAEAYCNRGTSFKDLRRFDEAMESYNKAISMRSDFADAYCNRSVVFNGLKCFDEALDDCNRAIALKLEFAHAYWNKSLIILTLGDYVEGWQLYEWRWQSIFKDNIRTFQKPLWLGDESISGKTILIYEEQGLGDVIQMCRYVSMLNACGANVVLEVPGSLVSLMSTLKGKLKVIRRGDPFPDFDIQCPIMSLPLAFRTVVESIPAAISYLSVDKSKQKIWKERLGKKNKAACWFRLFWLNNS